VQSGGDFCFSSKETEEDVVNWEAAAALNPGYDPMTTGITTGMTPVMQERM